MNIISYNTRGVGNLEKPKAIREVILSEKINLCMLEKT